MQEVGETPETDADVSLIPWVSTRLPGAANTEEDSGPQQRRSSIDTDEDNNIPHRRRSTISSGEDEANGIQRRRSSRVH
jgi:hypothetical protein